MAVNNIRFSEKRRIQETRREEEVEVAGSLFSLSTQPSLQPVQMDHEKIIRRQIANSNERRRMQSINTGFQSLRDLLPQSSGSEKLSKAAILQQTADYIYSLEQEKTLLLSQNCQLKRLHQTTSSHDSDSGSGIESPKPRRKKSKLAEVDEGIGRLSPDSKDDMFEVMKKDINNLQTVVQVERQLRLELEERLRTELRLRLGRENVKIEEDDVTSDLEQSVSPGLEVEEESRVPPVSLEIEHPASADYSSATYSYPADLAARPSPPVCPPTQTYSGPYHASTSQKNLATIVEAIRHLEGDHMFRDDPVPEVESRRNKPQPTSSHRQQIVRTGAIPQHRVRIIVPSQH